MTGKRRLVFVAALGIAALALSAGMVGATGDTEVSVEPANENVTVNNTQIFNIVVESASEDIGGYDFNVSLSNGNAAEIVSASPRQSPDGFNANISQDNTTVAVDAVWFTNNQVFQSTSPTILQVEVEGTAADQVDLDTDLASASGPYNELLNGSGDAYNVTASNAASITVEQPSAEFSVSNLSAPASAVEGDVVTANATVENTGAVQGSDTVEFRVDGNVVATTNVSLDAGASQDVSLSADTSGLGTGTFTHGIFTSDDSQTAQIELVGQAQPNFEVTSLDAPGTVTEGDVVTANATVENTGTAQGTETVEFRVDGNVVATTNVSLDAGASQDVSLSADTSGLGAGTVTHGVFVANSSQTAQLTIVQGGNVQIPGANNPATDTDGDGLLEDANGDGSFTPADVTILFNNRNSAAVQGNQALFDFNGDGQFTPADVTTLFNQVL